MLKNICSEWVLLTSAFCSLAILPMMGDIVEMENGSKIIGQARKLVDGKLTVTTPFAGDIAIDWEQVKTLETAVPQLSQLKPPPEPPAEEAQDERVWTYSIGFDLDRKTGNTDSMEYGLTAGAVRETKFDRLKLSLATEREEDDGEENANKSTIAADYQRFITDRGVWYGWTELHTDEFKDIDYRWSGGGGYGHYLLKQEQHSLQVRLGMRFTHEQYEEPEEGSDKEDRGTEDDFGLEFSAAHVIGLGKWLKIVSDVNYLPELTDTEKYRILHNTALEIPIGGSALWKLKLGVENEYDNKPAEDVERLDSSYFIRLVLNWENGKFIEASGLKNLGLR